LEIGSKATFTSSNGIVVSDSTNNRIHVAENKPAVLMIAWVMVPIGRITLENVPLRKLLNSDLHRGG
jgi:hypothetical protein